MEDLYFRGWSVPIGVFAATVNKATRCAIPTLSSGSSTQTLRGVAQPAKERFSSIFSACVCGICLSKLGWMKSSVIFLREIA